MSAWIKRWRCRREFRRFLATPRPFAMTEQQVEFFRESFAERYGLGAWRP